VSTPASAPAAWVTQPLGDLLDALASPSAPVGGGSVAALTAAMAAALVERCAAEHGDEALRARAKVLRGGLAALADADAAALVTLMREPTGDVDHETAGLLAEAASVPMRRLGECARELGRLARDLERDGKPWLRGEALCARALATASAEASAAIIACNGRPEPNAPYGTATAEPVVADLAPPTPGSGPRWGLQSDELNATLLTWPAGHEIAAHVNDEREVMLVVLAGSVHIAVDGRRHELSADQLLLLPRGCTRAITAGPEGVRYLSAHVRRGPLLPRARPAR
jgi:quercetin dioxygenase-like cupin family protein